MLNKIEAYLRSYLRFPDDRYYLPLALFAALQHCWDECFDEVPYLSVSAMVKGAGKTRVLELLQFLAGDDKAILVDGSVTVAALYTEIEEKKVILIDEAEKLQSARSPFRPILNGGYRRGQTVLRKIGKENVRFSIYCPKVFAQIGDVYDTLRDRCIIVEMQRTMNRGHKEFMRQIAMEEGTDIAHEIEETLGVRIDAIRDAYLNYHSLYPSLGFLRDRDREIWKPLFTLCQVFAPHRVPELEHLKDEEEKARKMEDAQRLFFDSMIVIGQRDRITSVELVHGLREIPTAPWRSYEGTGITEISLASMLRFFQVEPKTIRIKPKSQPNSTAKGYRREALDKAMKAIDAVAEGERNPVTPTHGVQKKQVAALHILPSPTPCGGCKDMHLGIAEMAKANRKRPKFPSGLSVAGR